jgi:predicted nucleic acid-binding protein
VIVYAETNFLLEIAYQQEGAESCRAILELTRQGKLSLVMPAFSVVEARQTWNRRSSEHNALQNQLQPIIRQISRSEPFRTVTESSRELLSALLASGEDTRLRLEETITALSSVATILPLDVDIVTRARHKELDLALSPSDAVVYAAVLAHLQSAPPGAKCFLNRDSKGFANPSVYDELGNFDCKLMASFEKGLDFIRSEMKAGSSRAM